MKFKLCRSVCMNAKSLQSCSRWTLFCNPMDSSPTPLSTGFSR